MHQASQKMDGGQLASMESSEHYHDTFETRRGGKQHPRCNMKVAATKAMVLYQSPGELFQHL